MTASDASMVSLETGVPPAGVSFGAAADAEGHKMIDPPGFGTEHGTGAATAMPRLRGEERWAVIAVALATAFLPLLKPGGPSNLALVDPLIGVALLASLLWAGTTRQRLRLPYVIPVALLLIGGAIGALVGPVAQTGAIALVQDLWLACWCWAVFNISRTARNLRIVLSTWIYSALVWGALLMVGIIISAPQLTGVNARDGSRVQLTFGDPSYAANYFFITMMLMWATQRPRRRWARYLGYAMFIIAMAFTGSNSGAVSLLVGGAIATVAGVRGRWGSAPAVATLTLFIIVGGLVVHSVSLTSLQTQAQGSHYAFIRDGLGRGTSVNQRGMLLGESLKLFQAGSIFGEGPASTKARLILSQAQFQKQAHDDYLGALTERGFIGLGGVLLLAASLLLRATGALRETLRNGFEAVVPHPNALLGAVLGTLVAATVYGLLHNRHIWTLFAITAAVSFWGRGYE